MTKYSWFIAIYILKVFASLDGPVNGHHIVVVGIVAAGIAAIGIAAVGISVVGIVTSRQLELP